MMYNEKKWVSGLLAVTVIVSLSVGPRHALAVTPVAETGLALVKGVVSAGANVATKLSTGATAASTAISAGKDTKDTIEDYVIRPLALALGRAAIKSITDSTVNWINGGFQGSPAFVTNLKTNLRQVADAEAQRFLTKLANKTKITSPWVDDLVTNVGTAYYLYSSKDALAARLRDTLGKASQNPAAFRSGNFQEGGWDAWFETFSNPANNPIGANMIASQAMAEQITAAVEQRTQELAWGKGFLSWRGDCIKTGTTQASGGVTVVTDVTSTTENGVTVSNGPDVTLNDAEVCLDHEIVTPGSYIESKLNFNTDSSLRQLELAQSIDQIVGALAQQLISQALGGSNGLRGSSNPSQGGGASPVTRTNPSTQTAVVSNREGLALSIQTSISQVGAWKTDSQTIATAALAARAVCENNQVALSETVLPALTTSQQALVRADSLLVALNALATKLQDQAAYQEVSSAYQQLLSGSADSLPSASVLAQASADAKSSGQSTTPSLYTELTTLASNGCQSSTELLLDTENRPKGLSL